IYNPRLQPCRLALSSSGTPPISCTDANQGNVLDFTYTLSDSNNHNNGNIMSWNATGQQSFNRSFSYDSLNRIATMQQSIGSAQACGSVFGLSWNIDPWGNRTDQNVTAGTCNSFHQTVNTKNQLVNGQYDAPGNLTSDSLHAYTFDAENRISLV